MELGERRKGGGGGGGKGGKHHLPSFTAPFHPTQPSLALLRKQPTLLSFDLLGRGSSRYLKNLNTELIL